ncbi:hypothetical protein NEOC95_001795, partial [Neochlamydia sp. AcF95]|nr:hypothetical protein [Neochlamydia sp. AcF95]
RSQASYRQWYCTQECGRVGRRQAFFSLFNSRCYKLFSFPITLSYLAHTFFLHYLIFQ